MGNTSLVYYLDPRAIFGNQDSRQNGMPPHMTPVIIGTPNMMAHQVQVATAPGDQEEAKSKAKPSSSNQSN